ncbi:MAG: DinB family protein [Acidobacteriota bacterium]
MSTRGKQQFLNVYDQEHATTVKVLRAYPKDKLDLQPHPKLKTARELAWVFCLEPGLGVKGWNDEFVKSAPSGKAQEAPADWDTLLAAIEKAHQDFRKLVADASDAELEGKIHFFTAPKTMGEYSRMEWAWFLLHDQIHHRGQFSIYLRMAEGKVPSIYGPTADEPWT